MNPYRKNLLFLLLFGALLCFSDLWIYPLESGDDTRVAGISESMFRTGDWVIPRLNKTPFLEYPPLYYQAAAVCFRLFGVTATAARLPSALSGFLAALLLFFWMKRKGGPPLVCLAAGVFFLCTASIFKEMKNCRVDLMLSFFMLLAWYGMDRLFEGGDRREKLLGFLAGAAGLCGGFMTKGPVGAAVPLSSAGIWLIVTDLLDRRFRFSRYFLLALMLFCAVLPVAFWYYEVYLRAGSKALHTAAMVNTFGRFSGSQGDHVKPFWFYLPRIPTIFAPWFPLLFIPWISIFVKKDGELFRKILFWFLGIAVPVILFSIAAGKREVYLLPLEAPAACTAAVGVTIFCRYCGKRWKWFPRRKHAVFLMGFLCAAVLTAGIAVVRKKKEKYSLEKLFAECASCEKKGYRILLDCGSERTMGAANFYLRKDLPFQYRPSKQNLNEPPPGTVWILRDEAEKRGLHFADRHVLLIGKQKE